MSAVQVQVGICKETMDVIDLVADLVAKIKAKKSAAEIAATELPLLMTAINGADQIPAETKLAEIDNTIALGLVKIEKALRS